MSRYADPVLPSLFADNQEGMRQFDRDLITALGNWSLSLKGVLDRGIALADNVDATVVAFTTPAAPDAEVAVPHTLGKIPAYFIVASIDKGGVVYKSATAFTKTNVYVKCTAASAAVKLILL